MISVSPDLEIQAEIDRLTILSYANKQQLSEANTENNNLKIQGITVAKEIEDDFPIPLSEIESGAVKVDSQPLYSIPLTRLSCSSNEYIKTPESNKNSARRKLKYYTTHVFLFIQF